MRTELLESILYCKFGLSRVGSSLKEYQVANDLCQFSSSIYK